jgi:hypothetical protein
LISGKGIYVMGPSCFDQGCFGFAAFGDTVVKDSGINDSFYVYWWGYCATDVPGNLNNYFTDIKYEGGADDDQEIFVSGSDDAEFWKRRTLAIHVKDASGDPVVSAACTVSNAYAEVVGTGTTNASGNCSTVVTYEYLSQNDLDSLRVQFNDFTIRAQKASDSLEHSFTVGWTDAGGHDTLQLGGTGTIPPTHMRDVYLRKVIGALDDIQTEPELQRTGLDPFGTPTECHRSVQLGQRRRGSYGHRGLATANGQAEFSSERSGR